MIIKSQAGEFEVTIGKFESENGYLVMVGKMGVWDARTYITGGELVRVLVKLLSPVVLLYLLKLPIHLTRKPSRKVGA